MVHAIRMLNCKQGHILPISYDSNNCGCEHKGNALLVVTCSECLKDYMKGNKKGNLESIEFPLSEEGKEIAEKM